MDHKLKPLKYTNPKLAVVIPTYYRKDGKTFNYIKRAIDSVLSQTYTNWKLYIIGDNYENKKEFNLIKDLVPKDKSLVFNLPVAVERERHPNDKEKLWHSGGAHSMNVGLEYAINQGYDYVCKLDHDDFYFPNHLEVLAKAIEETQSSFLYTKAKYTGNRILPVETPETLYTSLFPRACNVINSSTCVNYKQIPHRRRDPWYFYGINEPGDINFYRRIKPWFEENPQFTVTFINEITVSHIEEGYIKN